jgi:hypothetical protein
MRPTLLSAVKTSALVSSLGWLLSAGNALAADQWPSKGKECDTGAFKTPESTEVAELSRCSKAWIAYRTDLKAVKGEYKDRVVLAMQILYKKGDEADATRAKDILGKLGITELPTRVAAEPPKPKVPPRKVFSPPAPTKAELAAAKKTNGAGYGAAQKNELKKAIELYEKAIAAAPGWPIPHYNAACIAARLKEEPRMANHLMNLRDLALGGNAEAAGYMKQARTEKDFTGFRDESTEFKRITGYAKIKVINHIGEKGEENVDNLVGSLEKLGYSAESKESEKKVDKMPVIYFAEHARTQAFVTKQLIDHPKLQTKAMPKDKLCGDDGCYDVVVQWSDETKGDPKSRVADPATAEKKIAELEKKQDELLSKPDEAIDELNEALDKPAEAQEKIENLVDKPGKAVEKVEKSIDKVKSIF